MNDLAFTGPELRDRLRWAVESGRTPMFIRTVAEGRSYGLHD
jgi:hypothetical protein